jgi:hypothetical protein
MMLIFITNLFVSTLNIFVLYTRFRCKLKIITYSAEMLPHFLIYFDLVANCTVTNWTNTIY